MDKTPETSYRGKCYMIVRREGNRYVNTTDFVILHLYGGFADFGAFISELDARVALAKFASHGLKGRKALSVKRQAIENGFVDDMKVVLTDSSVIEDQLENFVVFRNHYEEEGVLTAAGPSARYCKQQFAVPFTLYGNALTPMDYVLLRRV